MKITVAGVGYVGLVTAAVLAASGYSVSCVDIDSEKVDMLNSGLLPIYEEGLQELMEKNRSALTFTTDPQAYSTARIIIIGVGTPELPDGSADLKAVYSVADAIARYASQDVLVVVKSTVPVGTCDAIEKYISEKNPTLKFSIASNPEFLSQGTAVKDSLYADRIVIGAQDARTFERMEELYAPLGIPTVKVSTRSSEMIKYASNDFLALKISYINEIANFCELIGADVEEVAQGMGKDKRIGSSFLKAGIGYGGSCFPKDTKSLSFQSDLAGVALKTVRATIDVNRAQRVSLVKKAQRRFPSLSGMRAAVLGLTFKPGTDDLREAPAIYNIELLLSLGVSVSVWDPQGMQNYKKLFAHTQVDFAQSIEEALREAQLCFIMTEWREIAEYPLENYVKYMDTPAIFDGRNCYSLSEAEKYPLIYESVGRRPIDNIKNQSSVREEMI